MKFEIVSTKVIASTSSSRLIADYFKTYLENLQRFEIYEICLLSTYYVLSRHIS